MIAYGMTHTATFGWIPEHGIYGPGRGLICDCGAYWRIGRMRDESAALDSWRVHVAYLSGWAQLERMPSSTLDRGES